MRSCVPGIGAVAALAILAGCAPVAGAMNMGGGDAWVCAPVSDGAEVLIGDHLVAPSDREVIVTAIDLVDPDGLTLVDSWLLPEGEGAIGAMLYPPPDSPSWRARVDPEGARLAPASAWNVVVLLSRTSEVATADAITVAYRDFGMEFRGVGSIAISLAAQCDGVEQED